MVKIKIVSIQNYSKQNFVLLVKIVHSIRSMPSLGDGRAHVGLQLS